MKKRNFNISIIRSILRSYLIKQVLPTTWKSCRVCIPVNSNYSISERIVNEYEKRTAKKDYQPWSNPPKLIWSELPEEKEYLNGTFTYRMYNAINNELLAECSIKEYYLNLIHDGLEGGSSHAENLFNKYVTLIFSKPDKKEVEIHESRRNSESYDFTPDRITDDDIFRDAFDGEIDAWNHWNQ